MIKKRFAFFAVVLIAALAVSCAQADDAPSNNNNDDTVGGGVSKTAVKQLTRTRRGSPQLRRICRMLASAA